MPCKLVVTLHDGATLEATRTGYDGLHTRPMNWDDVVAKFDKLAGDRADADLRDRIVGAMRDLERIGIRILMSLLAQVRA